MKKFIIYFFLGLFFSLVFSVRVYAEVYKFSEKFDNSEYQCIACEYEATNVNKSQHIVLYAKSDGKGGIDLSYEAFSMMDGKRGTSVVNWDVSTEKSSFINDDGDSLECPSVYIKDDGAGNGMMKYSVHFGNNSETQSNLVESDDNDNDFLDDGVDLSENVCSDVPIYILDAAIPSVRNREYSESNLKETDETGSIYKGSNSYLELPPSYKSVENWNDVDNALVEQCDDSLIIVCSERTVSGYQSAYTERNCYLTTNRKEKDSFNPSKVCGEDGEECDIDISGLCDKTPVISVLRFLGILLFVAKVLVPVLIIGMGIYHLFSIITSGKDDEVKKQVNNIVKRVIAGVIIFLLPSFVYWIFDVAGATDGGYSNCVNCILDLGKCETK